MAGVDLLERAAPDGLCTNDLPPVLASEIDLLAGRTDPWLETQPEVHPAVRARALLVAGQPQEARSALLTSATGPWSPQGLAAAVWVASRVDASELHPVLTTSIEALRDETDDGFLREDGVPLGPVAVFEGLLCVAEGQLDSALAHLQRAITVGDARAPVWGARCRLELYRVARTVSVLDAVGSGDADPHRGALVSARTFFAAGGYHHLRTEAVALAQPPELVETAAPTLGHLVLDGPAVVGFGVQPPVEVRTSKGLVALRHLLANCHRGVPAAEIDRVVSGQPVLDIDPDLLRAGLSETGLSDELRAVLFDDAARSRVTKLLRRTIDRVAEAHPVAGRHLAARVRTGFVCGYDMAEHVRWRL